MIKNLLIFILCVMVGSVLTLVYIQKFVFRETTYVAPLEKTQTPVATFSIETPPKESMVGNVASLSGEVFWQSRIASAPSALAIGTQVAQGIDVATGENGSVTMTCGDICAVSLSPQTSIHVIQLLPQQFVFRQDTGTATYVKGQSDIAVRSFDLLVSITRGTGMVTAHRATSVADIGASRGSDVSVAYNDAQNTTHVFSVDAGRILRIDIQTKRMRYVK